MSEGNTDLVWVPVGLIALCVCMCVCVCVCVYVCVYVCMCVCVLGSSRWSPVDSLG